MSARIAFYLGRRAENPGARWGDWLICAVTKSRFSHVELLVDMAPSPTGPVAVMVSASIRDGGVRETQRVLDPSRWVVVEFDADSTDAIKYVRSRIEQKVPYGWFDLLSFVLPWRVSWSGSDFCSEVIAAAFYMPTPWRTSPGQLFDWAIQQPGARVLDAHDFAAKWHP